MPTSLLDSIKSGWLAASLGFAVAAEEVPAAVAASVAALVTASVAALVAISVDALVAAGVVSKLGSVATSVSTGATVVDVAAGEQAANTSASTAPTARTDPTFM